MDLTQMDLTPMESDSVMGIQFLPNELLVKIFEEELQDRLFLLKSVCSNWRILIDSLVKRDGLTDCDNTGVIFESQSLIKLAPNFKIVLNKTTKIQAIDKEIKIQLTDLRPLTTDIVFAIAKRGDIDLLNQIAKDWPFKKKDCATLFEQILFISGNNEKSDERVVDWCLNNISLFDDNDPNYKTVAEKLLALLLFNYHRSSHKLHSDRIRYYHVKSFLRLERKIPGVLKGVFFSGVSVDKSNNFNFKDLFQLNNNEILVEIAFYSNNSILIRVFNDYYFISFVKQRNLEKLQQYLNDLKQHEKFVRLQKIIHSTLMKTLFDYDWYEVIPLFEIELSSVQRLTQNSLKTLQINRHDWFASLPIFDIIFQQNDLDLLEFHLNLLNQHFASPTPFSCFNDKFFAMSSTMFGHLIKVDKDFFSTVKKFVEKSRLSDRVSIDSSDLKTLRTLQIVYDFFRKHRCTNRLDMVYHAWNFLIVVYPCYKQEKHDTEIISNLIDHFFDQLFDSPVKQSKFTKFNIDFLETVRSKVNFSTYSLLFKFLERIIPFYQFELHHFLNLFRKYDQNFASFVIRHFPNEKINLNIHFSRVDQVKTLIFLLQHDYISINRINFVCLINVFLDFDRLADFNNFYQLNQLEWNKILDNDLEFDPKVSFPPEINLPSSDYSTFVIPFITRFKWIEIKQY